MVKKIALMAIIFLAFFATGKAVKNAALAYNNNELSKWSWGGGVETDGSAPWDGTNTNFGWISMNSGNCDKDNNGFIDSSSFSSQVFDNAIANPSTLYDTNYLSSVTLNNGNVLVAYPDYASTNYGTFFISDPLGNVVKTPTVFASTSILNLGKNGQLAAALNNGNVFIAFSDGNNSNLGNFVIYDSTGNPVRSATVFNNSGTEQVSVGALSNGNVLIAYYDVTAGNQYFVIYNQNGNPVTASPIEFGAGDAIKIQVKSFSGGNAMIAYDEANSADGRFVIIDQNGNTIKTETIFESSWDTQLSLAPLADNRMLIAYSDYAGSPSAGKYAVYDSTGQVIKGPTAFSGDVYNISATALGDGTALVAYGDNNNNDYGTYVNIDSGGNLTKGPEVFRNSYVSYISAATLKDGNAYIAFTDGDLNNDGLAGTLDLGCGGKNDATTPVLSNYGVNIDSVTGKLSGYAWSENLGWISFNRKVCSGGADNGKGCFSSSDCVSPTTCSDTAVGATSIPPAMPYNGSEDYVASYDSNTNAITGWARIVGIKDESVIGNSGDWQGWIKLSGATYGVSINPATNKLSGYAWSDELGWIDFNMAEITGGPQLKICGATILTNQTPTEQLSAWYWADLIGTAACSDTSSALPVTELSSWTSTDPTEVSVVDNAGSKGIISKGTVFGTTTISAAYAPAGSASPATVDASYLETILCYDCSNEPDYNCNGFHYDMGNTCLTGNSVQATCQSSCVKPDDYNWREVAP